jgi:hypothetical protein
MQKTHISRCGLLVTILFFVGACGVSDESVQPGQAGGKADNAWLSAKTYELDGVLASQVTVRATGDLAELATNRGLQEQLVDDQIKFGKTSMKKMGEYHLSQLAETVTVESVDVEPDEENGDLVTIKYRAAVDLTGRIPWSGEPPRSLEDLDQTEFVVPLPLDPLNMKGRFGDKCANWEWDEHPYDYNYYYYFDPHEEGCDVELSQAGLKLTKLHPQRVAYPEYDRLLKPLSEELSGFTVAVLPGVATDTVRNRLENELNLEGEDVEGESFTRYRLGGEKVEVVIDFFPSQYYFRQVLGSYQLIYYHGHSNYGTQPYFTDPKAFTSEYQIIAMSSCRSYSYYARQIMDAKATQSDPKGWDATDVIANVNSGWVGSSSSTLTPLLRKLRDGIEAVHNDRPHEAPDWLSIVKEMDRVDSYPMYGLAGVRENRWKPPAP